MPQHRLYMLLALLACLLLTGSVSAQEANFTRQDAAARLYGTHEIVLRGNGIVPNPFETQATITFTPPSGAASAVTVAMFYDGENVWRGRTYVSEAGEWAWATQSPDDPLLDGKTGRFTALESDLPGMLRQHPQNPRHWATEDGRWFLNLSDTAYRLFNLNEPLWREYVHDVVALGITSVRSGALGGWEWLPEDQGEFGASNYPWDGEDFSRYDLDKFRNTDMRLQWLLNTYPDLYVQFILFGQTNWTNNDAAERWFDVPPEARENTMRYMLARWAAYPHIFWLTVNDLRCGEGFELSEAYTREIGRFFAAHDPWGHLLSTSPGRDDDFCFAGEEDADWVSYIHLQGSHELDARRVDEYAHLPLHVFFAEDYYEQEHPTRHPEQPDYFYRWLFWSWTLAGGSANYGGRYWVLHPYSQTGDMPVEFRGVEHGQLTGLDSIMHLRRFFEDRAIDLTQFHRANDLAASISGPSGTDGIRAVRVAVRGDLDEILIYHPHAFRAGPRASVWEDRPAALHVDLTDAPYMFSVEWYRAADGESQMGEPVAGGDWQELTAPWEAADVVLRLQKDDPLPAD